MEKLLALLESRNAVAKLDRTFGGSELEHLLRTPGYTTDKSQLRERGLEEFKGTKMENKTNATSVGASEPSDLAEFCDLLTKAFEKSTETFMLNVPAALTVKKPSGAFSKVAHIGSEDFKPVRAYLGVKKNLILVFTPVMVSDYVEMEMPESTARVQLTGFKEWLDENLGYQMTLEKIRVNMANVAEKASLKDKYEQYKDIGFGSW